MTMLVIMQAVNAVVSYIYNSYYSGRFIDYGIWSQLKDIAPILLVALISGAFVIVGQYFFYENLSHLLQLIIGFATGYTVYFLSTFLLKLEAFHDFKITFLNVLNKKQKIKIVVE
jgi:hypothetical protein